MAQEFGFKELYDVSIKTTSQIEMNGKILEPGETVISFDEVTLSNFQEIRKITTANGGFDNRPHIWWETVKDVSLNFNQGIFSKDHFAMMVNAQIFQYAAATPIFINQRESLESDEECKVTLKYVPYTPIYVYDTDGNKLTYTINDKVITIPTAYTDVLIDYYYQYLNGYTYIRIGEELTHNYFTLEGKTRVKDDITGNVKTGLLRIPKMKLVSDLSMKLGKNATPVMGSLDAVACPTGVKGSTTVMELIFLNDDIDADM